MSPRTAKPYAIYARLSKAAQTGDLEKVEYQEELCRRYAQSRDLPVSDAHIFVDNSLSAWKKRVRRPAWEALMEAAGRGELAGILVYAVDRFTRRPKDLETLIELAEDHGLAIEGPRSGRLDLTTATGRQQARWMAMQAASESDNTSERVKSTLTRKMAEGKPMGSGRAFAFEVGGTVQRDEEVGILREVAADFLAEKPLQVIADELNTAGITTARGKGWTGANVGRMLGLKRYGGIVEHHGVQVGTMPGEPVFDAETFDAIAAKLASRRRGRRPTGPYLLTGILVCSDCEKTMNGGSTFARADGNRPRVYKCSKLSGGCARSIMAEPVEALVRDHVLDLMADPRNAARIAKQTRHLDEIRSALRAKRKGLTDQQEDLVAKWAAGELTDASYERALSIINGRLAKVGAELDEGKGVDVHTFPADTPETKSKAKAARLREAGEDWSAMTPEQKRTTLRTYRVRPVVDARRSGTRRMDLGRVRFL